ncbi:diaminopimelate decarboxylase [Stenotrophomonas mori]|uniref:Diaminopimelate decarboxylase n=1 Tax=Stenotrophomonas mori TaxID=2871096 RepID=A0ABT0SJJ6_9GAMM|nr:diaminopimelate decarboxylase [Stenotrophomonas mori]MCL7715499.1 diaminopimelate decarboxylase [Stenotrophomonas mori]
MEQRVTRLGTNGLPEAFQQVDLAALAAREGTPLYVYAAPAIRERVRGLREALAGLDAGIRYAVKANGNGAVLRLLAEEGAGADIVSGGELQRALRAGIAAADIVFSGVGKSDAEIALALEVGIGRFNIESRAELDAIQRIAAARGDRAVASVRINPDVDAQTHAKISTGKAENKFGVSIDEARAWFAAKAQWPDVQLDGLHMHIGSQLLSLDPVREALARMAAFWKELDAAGHAIASIDVGGGLGVRYREGEHAPDAREYADAIARALAGFRGRILVEPGRWLVAEAGLVLTRAMLEKHGEQRSFLVLDAAMNDLLRPSLYDAWHDIVRIGGADGRDATTYDVVGPVCETGDTFATGRTLPRCEAGDLVAILGAGAYAASMGSTYNSRPLPAEVMVDGARYAVVRRRQSLEEMLGGEQPATDWKTP